MHGGRGTLSNLNLPNKSDVLARCWRQGRPRYNCAPCDAHSSLNHVLAPATRAGGSSDGSSCGRSVEAVPAATWPPARRPRPTCPTPRRPGMRPPLRRRGPALAPRPPPQLRQYPPSPRPKAQKVLRIVQLRLAGKNNPVSSSTLPMFVARSNPEHGQVCLLSPSSGSGALQHCRQNSLSQQAGS